MFSQFKSRINNNWFFEQPATYLKYGLVFIQGDALVLLPLFMIIFFFGFISLDFMLVLIGLYVAFRSVGEMMFWMLQQFGARTYRPYDFGLVQLDNHAIYIIYQLLGLAGSVLGFGLVIMILFF